MTFYTFLHGGNKRFRDRCNWHGSKHVHEPDKCSVQVCLCVYRRCPTACAQHYFIHQPVRTCPPPFSSNTRLIRALGQLETKRERETDPERSETFSLGQFVLMKTISRWLRRELGRVRTLMVQQPRVNTWLHYIQISGCRRRNWEKPLIH